MTISKIKINALFLLNNFMFYMQKLINVCTAPVAYFMHLYLDKQIFIYIYEKVDMIKF